MARGSLPAQTPQVPSEVFLAFQLVYTYLLGVDKDLFALEGAGKTVNGSITTSTVLVADPDLQFQLGIAQKVRFSALLFFTANVKYRFTGPAGAAKVLFSSKLIDTGFTSALYSAYHGADVVLANAGVLELEGIIHNGTTAGKVAIQWAQNASSGTPSTLFAGSVLRYSPIV